ncbi:MAG: hypothetical protein KGZ40_04630 [Clostridiales bacterium]|nr:hypothetical protein [Clostridiales bacterium]
MVASQIDGRLRFRHAGLRDPAIVSEVESALRGARGILSVTSNARTGSMLVKYDHEVITAEQVVEASQLPASASAIAQQRLCAPMTQREKMRIAKRGMLGSLGALLLLAALDRERAHMVAGGLFVAFNAYHLYTYRRRLLL